MTPSSAATRSAALPSRSWTAMLAAVLSLACAALAPTWAHAARPAPSPATDVATKQAAWAQFQRMEAESPFKALAWRSIGPTGQGGRVVEVLPVPGDPAGWYVAYATGGVWKTVNDGATFTPLTDKLYSTVVGAIATDPSAPQTLWVGSGEPNAARSNYGGNGLYVSRDGGATFEHKGLADADRIARIVVDPRNSQRVFVAAAGKLYSTGGSRGIYLTEDGGQTWKPALRGEGPWTGAIDLIMEPGNPDVLYAALWDRERKPWQMRESGKGSGVYKSSDGGRTWARLAGLPSGAQTGRIGLAISHAKPRTLYAAVDLWDELPQDLVKLGDRALSAKRFKTMTKEEFLRQDPEEVESFIRSADLPAEFDAAKLMAGVREGRFTLDQVRSRMEDANEALFAKDIWGLTVWRSDDAGATWRRTHDKPISGVTYTYGYYFGQVRVDPQNAERVYVGGVPLIVSNDGGATWSGAVNHDSLHADHHALWIDAQNPKRMVTGNDGGLNLSHDGGITWRKLDGQPVGQFYTITADMAEPYTVYGGLQDNGVRKGSSRTRWELGEDWSTIGGGDGMAVAVDDDSKSVYAGFQFGFHTRTDADGKRSEVRPRTALTEPPLRFNWLTPLILSPHNPQIVYVGSERVERSMDKGKTFAPISGDLTSSKARGNVPFATLSTLAESPLRFGQLAAGSDDGRVHITRDGGATWQAVDGALPSDRWVSRVEWSRHTADRLYVSLNGYRQDDDRAYLYVSDDLGKTWRSLSAGLPTESINVVREDPVNADVLYVGTDRSVYVSLDAGKTWASLSGNLPHVPVHDLFVHPRDRELIAGTHGRSAWIVDVMPIQQLTPTVRAKAVHLFKLDAVQADRGWRSAPDPWWDRPQYLPKVSGTVWAAKPGPVVFELIDADGTALAQFTRDAAAGLNSFEWDLLLDAERVKAAEAASLAKLPEAERGELRNQRYAESLRLGHRLYPLPGKYTLRAASGEARSDTPLEVKAPKPRDPRFVPKYKLRGEGNEATRTQPEPKAHPRAGSRARPWTVPGK